MLDVLLGMSFFDCLFNGVLVVFCEGDIIFIPTASSENAINASWLIILGVQNADLGVPCSTCSIWNIGFSTLEICFGVLFALYLSALRSSFDFFASSLFSCLVFLSFLEFIFLSLFWPPSESAIGGKNLCHLPYLLFLLVFVLV